MSVLGYVALGWSFSDAVYMVAITIFSVGYGEVQLRDMETTINNTECDAVVIATPIDLNRIIKIEKPNTRVYYNLQEIGRPNFDQVLEDFVKKHNLS